MRESTTVYGIQGELEREIKKKVRSDIIEQDKTIIRRIEMIKEILSRLKSPVILIQIIGTIVGVLIYFAPNQAEAIQIVTASIVALINIFSGLNNPSDSKNF